ncbi:MAG: hypothetical protein Q8L35_07300 [Actinomycetota bacterium]|nr:hypothetical protein [Actinomycetota bacterium]
MKQVKGVGAGGPFDYWVGPQITIEFEGIDIVCKNPCFRELRDKQGREIGQNLLGRNDFFAYFWVAFDHPMQQMKITPHKKRDPKKKKKSKPAVAAAP